MRLTATICLAFSLVDAAAVAAPTDAVAAPTLANPASELCMKNGATVTNETRPNGAQRGICVFPNGTRIDEWAYFRNKHRTQR